MLHISVFRTVTAANIDPTSEWSMQQCVANPQSAHLSAGKRRWESGGAYLYRNHNFRFRGRGEGKGVENLFFLKRANLQS